jgi:hypothetical protein
MKFLHEVKVWLHPARRAVDLEPESGWIRIQFKLLDPNPDQSSEMGPEARVKFEFEFTKKVQQNIFRKELWLLNTINSKK